MECYVYMAIYTYHKIDDCHSYQYFCGCPGAKLVLRPLQPYGWPLKMKRFIWNIQNFCDDVTRQSTVQISMFPDSKVHGPNMGPTWVLSAPDGPHVEHEPCYQGCDIPDILWPAYVIMIFADGVRQYSRNLISQFFFSDFNWTHCKCHDRKIVTCSQNFSGFQSLCWC